MSTTQTTTTTGVVDNSRMGGAGGNQGFVAVDAYGNTGGQVPVGAVPNRMAASGGANAKCKCMNSGNCDCNDKCGCEQHCDCNTCGANNARMNKKP